MGDFQDLHARFNPGSQHLVTITELESVEFYIVITINAHFDSSALFPWSLKSIAFETL